MVSKFIHGTLEHSVVELCSVVVVKSVKQIAALNWGQ